MQSEEARFSWMPIIDIKLVPCCFHISPKCLASFDLAAFLPTSGMDGTTYLGCFKIT